MDDARWRERLRKSEQGSEALRQELALLRASVASTQEALGAFRRDYDGLVDATRIITAERDALQQRVAELEVVNRRLVDMLWGRRSERRNESPDQQHLSFAADPPSAAEQEIITAQAEADEAEDAELLRRLAARRRARLSSAG